MITEVIIKSMLEDLINKLNHPILKIIVISINLVF
jgi:hypothetical protein